MRGNGTRPGTTTSSPPPARLLDLTRLVSRAGRAATGVDRVELAYLARLLNDPVPLFALIRTTLGFVLLDRAGAQALSDRLNGRRDWGRRDWLSVAARSKPDPVRQAESDLRRFALARSTRRGLARMLSRHLPAGTSYLNVGHSNLTGLTLGAVRHALGARIAVLVHDTIPLDFPEYQRPGTPERFAGMIRRVTAHADLVICNSADTETRFRRHTERESRHPKCVIAHLGVTPADPDPDALPPGLPPKAPYFVAVGTIEPRKRYDLLLDLWDGMADPPGLFICGSRGWRNEEVFERLDRLPRDGAVQELNGLNDGALSALVAGSTALLFPSDAEGFGLPPLEAVALGTPVVCQDLPVFRELLGDIPVYASGTDRYQWQNKIERLIHDQKEGARAARRQVYVPPDWESHFNIVLKLT